MTDAQLVVGVVVGAHGVRGGLRVKMFDAETALPKGLAIQLRRPDADGVDTAVVADFSRVPHTTKARMYIEGVADKDGADALRGVEIRVDRQDLPDLEDDEFYLTDAVGLPVVRDGPGPTELGTVIGVVSNGPQDLLEVACSVGGRRKTWLLPVVPGFVLDLDEHRVLVEVGDDYLPEGFGQPRRLRGARAGDSPEAPDEGDSGD